MPVRPSSATMRNELKFKAYLKWVSSGKIYGKSFALLHVNDFNLLGLTIINKLAWIIVQII